MLMFHDNLVHGSAGNITTYRRRIAYLTLNSVSEDIRAFLLCHLGNVYGRDRPRHDDLNRFNQF